MLLSIVLEALQGSPGVTTMLLFSQFINLFDLISHLCQHLIWNQSADLSGPPICLPANITSFLCTALNISADTLVKFLEGFSSIIVDIWR
jgi:hypothetical protein